MSQQQLLLLHFFKKSFNVIVQANGEVPRMLHETFPVFVGLGLDSVCAALRKHAPQTKDWFRWDSEVQGLRFSGQDLLVTRALFLSITFVIAGSGI